MLQQFGQFPDKYRMLTWRYLLDLPLNKEAFQGLLSCGIHPSFKSLSKRIFVESTRLYNKLVRIMSALANWSPIFAEVEYLPAIVLSLLKIIPNDDLYALELIMSLIVQWMQVWFETYPCEPVAVVGAVESLIDSQEPRILQHLSSLGYAGKTYIWPLFSNLFSVVLAKEDWLRLLDHLFVNRDQPELLVFFGAAFIVCSKPFLMQVGCIEEL